MTSKERRGQIASREQLNRALQRPFVLPPPLPYGAALAVPPFTSFPKSRWRNPLALARARLVPVSVVTGASARACVEDGKELRRLRAVDHRATFGGAISQWK